MMAMGWFSENNKSGFTLIEILISMGLGMVIMGALANTFVIQQKSYDVQRQISEATQMARAAMDMLIREVRAAGYDPEGTGFTGIPYSATQLQLFSDIDGSGDTGQSNENITYKYYDETDQIKRRTGNGGFQPFAENVWDFEFQYLDNNRSTTTTATEIRQIRITLAVRTEKADSDYSSNDGYRVITLSSYIVPRNLGYSE